MSDLSYDLTPRVSNKDNIVDIDTFFKLCACLDINFERVNTNLAGVTKGNAGARRIFNVVINLQRDGYRCRRVFNSFS